MARGYLALVVELHHRLPGPGRGAGSDWACAAAETYWPLLRAIAQAADLGLSRVLTLAVSPSWSALAADPGAQALARVELDRRADRSAREGDGWNEHWRDLRRFVERWGSDPLGPLRRAHESGAVEVIPTTASHAWLPGVVDVAAVARAQVATAAADHSARFGTAPQGIWLPHLSYRPGLERAIAGAGLRYFGVDADAFRRGTLRPPLDAAGPMVTPPGAAAFGVDPEPTRLLIDPRLRFSHDPRDHDPRLAPSAIADHAAHFVASWLERAEAAPRGGPSPPISVAAVSAHDLGGSWRLGAEWLARTLQELTSSSPWVPITPGGYLDHHPEGPVGRPGPSAGGWLSARPAGSDLLDRCRVAADAWADALAHRAALGPLGRRALAQMTRSLLAAQALDWSIPPGFELPPSEALAHADGHLARVAELAGSLSAGRLDPARIAALEAGPTYLAEIDLDLLGDP